MQTIAKALATTLYTGYSPVAPGTVGAGLTVLALLACGWPGGATLLLLVVGVFFVGVWASARAEKEYGHDAGKINIDEVVGMLVAALPTIGRGAWLVVAFLFFRLFDVVKPYPANRAQDLPGGWGVMVDDVVAGLYAAVVLLVADALM